MVSPSAKVLPGAGTQVTTGSTTSLSSDAVATKLTMAPVGPVASTVWFGGSVRTGGVVSPTVMVKTPFATLPVASVAVQFTRFSPIGNTLPEAGVQKTAGLGSAASVAVAANVTAAPVALVASALISAGKLSTGGVVSTTCMV